MNELKDLKLKEERGVYIITNLVNGMVYVGETINIKDRFKKYKYSKHGTTLIYKDITELGIDKFRFEVEYFPNFTDEDLLDLEEALIKRFDCLYPNGYNKCKKGNDHTDVLHTENSRNKMSISRSGSKNHFFNKTHTEEAKKKISNAPKSVKPIIQWTKDGKTIINRFPSIVEASKQLNLNECNISLVCSKQRKSSGGFCFSYDE
jgi:excinuclease UvrABC nuclease subunit